MSIDSGQDAEIQRQARMHDIQAERAFYTKPDQTRGEFLAGYLNNIVNVMPVLPGHEKVDRMGMNKRLAFEQMGLSDTKCNDIKYFQKGKNSDLLLSQTPKEFFETIDGVLVELGIDINQIGQYQHDMIEGDHDAQLKILDLVEPAYVKLREMGYNRVDLTV